MNKERFILNLIVFVVLLSCKKEIIEVPDYQPGRITEISYETGELGLTSHNYEYAENEVIDKYYFSSPEVFISKYHFNNDQLVKVYYSLENTNEVFYIDSLTYIYSDSLIMEVNHYTDNSCDTIVYFIENGKIISSTNKPESTSSDGRIDCFYVWNGDNLIRYEEQIWFFRESPIVTSYVFQYTAIENPLFYSNIPKLMSEFIPPQGGRYYELAELVPKCSKNFPLKVTIYYNYIPGTEDIYSFESKTFQNDNKPYKVRVVHTQYFTDYYDYFLTYEEL
jgi:hypothetical protein